MHPIGEPSTIGRPERRASSPLVLTLLVALLCFAGAKIGNALTPANDPFVTFWLPSGVLVGFLMASPRSRWAGLMGAGGGAIFVFNLLDGRPWFVAAGFVLANLAECYAGAALYRRLSGTRSPLKRERDLIVFMLCPGLLGPALGATIGHAVLHLAHAATHELDVWTRWWLGDMIGVLLVAPAVVVLNEEPQRDGIRRCGVECGCLALATVILAWFALVRDPNLAPPWKFLLVLLSAWAGLRLDVRALVGYNLALGIGSTALFELMNRGAANEALDRAATLWLGFAGSCAAVALTIAMLRRQSGRHANALQSESDRLKLAHACGQTGAWDCDFETGRVEWSEEHAQLWGVSLHEFDGQFATVMRCIHADDVAGVLRDFNHAKATGGEHRCDFRVIRPDGETRWMESRGKVVFNETGRPIGMSGVAHDITARKQAEESLRSAQQALAESQALLNAILNSTEDFIWSVDPKQFRLQTFNRALGSYFAERRGTALQPSLAPQDVFAEREFAERWREMYVTTLTRGRYESDYATSVGQQVLRVTMHPMQRDGRITGIAVFARNITEQKRAEGLLQSTQAALIESQTQLNAVIDSTSDLVWSVDVNNFRLLTANRAHLELFQRLHGRPLRIGQCLDEVYLTEERRSVWRTYYRRAATQGGFEVEYETKQGNHVFHLRLNPLRRHGAVFAIAVFARDITEQRAAQSALRTSERQLRLVNAALQSAANAIVITDRTGKIEWVNAAFTEYTGYSAAEAIGNTPSLLRSGQHEAAFYRDMWGCIEAGKVWHGAVKNRRKDGTVYEEEMTITPLRDAAGVITHFIAVKQDVTERNALESRVRQTQKIEAVGQLAGGVAHDFNNVMAATLLNLSQLQREPQLSPVVRDSLKELELEIRRASGLTRQLLLFSRRQTAQMKPTDLTDVVLNMSRMLRRLIGENVTIAFPDTADAFWIDADPGMIEQVIMNLCLNARDAMPGGGELRIVLRRTDVGQAASGDAVERPAGRYVVIEVRDTGCGMDDATLKRLFEPFFTTKEIGRGTGLGLATAFGIVRQHRGWIEVQSTVGGGSTFSVYVPELATNAPVAEPSDAAIRGGNETVLLVEDDTPVRNMTALTLQAYGYRVLKARDTTEAMEIWHEQGLLVELLITDMIMPGKMNGAQLAEVLRERRPTLPVIVTSGYTPEICDDTKLRIVGIAHVAKPYTAERLVAVVRQTLDAKAAQRARSEDATMLTTEA